MNDLHDEGARAPDISTESGLHTVLREAGRRREPPPADLAAIAGAARGAWETAAAGRRQALRRHILLAAAGLAVLVGSGWWWRTTRPPAAGAPPAGVARVERWAGAARLSGRAVTHEEISSGAVLSTDAGGAGSSFLSARLSSGGSLRLDSGTTVRLVSPGLVELRRGAVYIDSPARSGGPIEVRTAIGSVRDVGTQFEVRLEGEAGLTVRVREGRVALVRDARELSVEAGEELAWRPGGEATRARIPAFGESWQWAAAAAVAPAIDGRPLAEVLAWFSRETGRGLAYADSGLAAEAERIRLHGSVEDLSPAQALEVVLAGSGLAYRLEPGVVRIDRQPPR